MNFEPKRQLTFKDIGGWEDGEMPEMQEGI